VRRIRRTLALKAPTAQRITDLATQLAAHESLASIKKKDYLIRYIELYIIRVLSQR